jgi:multidrug efflux pump
MNFTDIFIRRPVLATVVSLMILVIGLRAFSSLAVREYPKTENAVATISTTFFGADPATVAGFITTPLENAIAQANGIDYMTSVSQNGTSTITVNLRLNYDADTAITEINTKINSVLNQLPTGTLTPTITVKVGQSLDDLIIGFASDVLQPNQITDYLVREVQPKLQAVTGVQTAELLGPQYFALRAWLDPAKLASYGVTASDVSSALTSNDYISGLGTTRGQMVQVNLTASTNLHSLSQFENLVIKQINGGIIRLKDVARVSLGADSYDAGVSFDGKKGVYVGIQIAPSANLLSVIAGVKAVLPQIQAQLPEGLTSAVIYDDTDFVNSAIREVATTLTEALVIVTLVVFAFLGSLRSVMIPVVAIPLSLVGTFTMMLMFGFSINLLTLLALVLAIGLVVDDAIIVVESVNRHLSEGRSALDAALLSARELGSPIIAMTVVLVAVYLPIGFQGGLTGALFTEFAFTLVGTITVSAVIALTLTPMMCSRLLKPRLAGSRSLQDRLVDFIDRRFEGLRGFYERRLHSALNSLPVIGVFAAIMLGSIYFLYAGSQSELAPQEDQGVVIVIPTSAPTATLDQKLLYGSQAIKIFQALPEAEHIFQVEAPTQSIAGVTLKPWDQRSRTATQIQQQLQQQLSADAGQRIVAFQPPPLPGSVGLPVQFVIKTTQPFSALDGVAQSFLHEAQGSGNFIFLDSDLKIDLPQSVVEIDRSKAAELGLNMNSIGSALTGLLGGGYVNYFDLASRSYKVIPQVEQRFRLNQSQLLNYTIANTNNIPVALSTVAHIRTETVPESLNHFQQLNSATISGVVTPGVSQAQAITYLQDLAARLLPSDYSIDYGGAMRQYQQESSGFVTTFALSVIIIFLSLAALFESFRDPVVILISVPMSIAGALIFISLGVEGATLNIYTQVGLVTLMGLVSKHGILMVEVANALQAQGIGKRAAIEEAAGVRLRPILMTTAAMVLGVIPLVLASGAGAASRFSMGLVISTGLSIGTLFTLFVVPGVYMMIAADHAAEAVADAKARRPVA